MTGGRMAWLRHPLPAWQWAPVLAVLAIWVIARGVAALQPDNGFDLSDALVPRAAIESGGPGRDGIPALDRPAFIAAAAATHLAADDRVLGLRRHGVAKAYPIAILNWHEIVNDRLGDEAVAVTYCPLCGSGVAFLAEHDGRVLEFGVSGLLYNSDVLLYDRQTESLWSQLGMRAISGPLRGQRLTVLPLQHTSWADWRARHPDTFVLSPDTGYARDYDRDPYQDYASSARIWFAVQHRDARLPPKAWVLGVEDAGEAKAYPFSLLAEAGQPLHDRLGGRPIRVDFDPAHRSGRVRDADTGAELPSVTSYWFAWYAFHPGTSIWSLPAAEATP